MQEIFPTRLMDATGRLYSERASPGQAIEAFFFSAIQQPGRA